MNFNVNTVIVQIADLPDAGTVGMASDQATQIAMHGKTGGTAYVAWNEENLASSLAQIVQSAVLVEKCNGVDDNCNGLIDEGFSNLSATCSVGVGACYATGTYVCNPTGDGVVCGATAGTPGTEFCNGVDDDCNGIIDDVKDSGGHLRPPSYCAGCENTPEICNGLDDNCNGETDENLTRSCSRNLGACTTGTQMCTGARGGVWGACSGVEPTAESCNGTDDDCNGVVDDVKPGDMSNGVTWGADCSGSGPSGAGLCSTSTWQCVSGAKQCTSTGVTMASTPEVCDCRDNNCNGAIDGIQSDGTAIAELVDCPAGNPAGTSCLPFPFCQCAHACNPGEEIPCSVNQICVVPDSAHPTQGYCVADKCHTSAAPHCAANETCKSDSTGAASCVDLCAPTGGQPACPSGYACRSSNGMVECVSTACDGGPCTTITCGDMICPNGSSCVNGRCYLPGQDGGMVMDMGTEPHRVLATGGGGFSCSTANTSDNNPISIAFFSLGLVVLVTRRRARRGGAR